MPEDQIALISALAEYGAAAMISARFEGPRTRTYQVVPAPGVRINRMRQVMRDVQIRLAAPSCALREDAGQLFVEIGRGDAYIPRLSDLPAPEDPLDIIAGVDTRGQVVTIRPEKFRSCLVAGTTGGGKSTAMRVIMEQFLRVPESSVVVIDPKASGEFHVPPDKGVVVSQYRPIANFLNLVAELITARAPGGRYNERTSWFPSGPVLLVVDEVQTVRDVVQRLALWQILSTGRSVGVHCLLATQHPSAALIGNEFRSNCPTRLVLQVASASDSRVAMDQNGAEQLLGRGDALLRYDGTVRRIQVPSVD